MTSLLKPAPGLPLNILKAMLALQPQSLQLSQVRFRRL
jgi:hypothetical protein